MYRAMVAGGGAAVVVPMGSVDCLIAVRASVILVGVDVSREVRCGVYDRSGAEVASVGAVQAAAGAYTFTFLPGPAGEVGGVLSGAGYKTLSGLPVLLDVDDVIRVWIENAGASDSVTQVMLSGVMASDLP